MHVIVSHDLTIISMILNASIVVKVVMAILLAASMLSWTYIFMKMFSIRRARLKFTYQFSPTSRFVLQPDISSSGVVLKDGYVEFTEPWTTWKHTLTAGQWFRPDAKEVSAEEGIAKMQRMTGIR